MIEYVVNKGHCIILNCESFVPFQVTFHAAALSMTIRL